MASEIANVLRIELSDLNNICCHVFLASKCFYNLNESRRRRNGSPGSAGREALPADKNWLGPQGCYDACYKEWYYSCTIHNVCPLLATTWWASALELAGCVAQRPDGWTGSERGGRRGGRQKSGCTVWGGEIPPSLCLLRYHSQVGRAGRFEFDTCFSGLNSYYPPTISYFLRRA